MTVSPSAAAICSSWLGLPLTLFPLMSAVRVAAASADEPPEPPVVSAPPARARPSSNTNTPSNEPYSRAGEWLRVFLVICPPAAAPPPCEP